MLAMQTFCNLIGSFRTKRSILNVDTTTVSNLWIRFWKNRSYPIAGVLMRPKAGRNSSPHGQQRGVIDPEVTPPPRNRGGGGIRFGLVWASSARCSVHFTLNADGAIVQKNPLVSGKSRGMWGCYIHKYLQVKSKRCEIRGTSSATMESPVNE